MGRIKLVAFVVIAACSSDSTTKDTTPPDAAKVAVDASSSTCGQPGDTGNEMGIGHYCNSFSDCSQTANAPLCSSIGDATTHFCTTTCSATGSAGQCGTGVTCECNSSNQCGCTPNACL